MENQETIFNKTLESILKYLLPDNINKAKKPKVIHDTIWGTRIYLPWEIALIDTPLIQRLRGIHQLGTTFFTYPSAIHNRFSHTLGVVTLADQLIARLDEKELSEKLPYEITPKDRNTVRLAGLLHDIGHCFFSHASEQIIGPLIESFKKEKLKVEAKPHEFISYLILTHDYFKDFWDSEIKPLFPQKDEIPDLKEIANIIVGNFSSNERKFLQEIISGPYDVDKIEYLYRDSKMAGLEIGCDIERFLYKINVKKINEKNRLVMEYGGIRVEEQIIFNKMMLHSFLYHHQKVLATDCLVIDLLVELLSNENINPIKITNPLDFLRYNDYDLLSFTSQNPDSKFDRIKKRLLSRQLPKRCLVIKRSFIKNLETDTDVKRNYSIFKKNVRNIASRIEEREKIVNILKKNNKNVSLEDIYINYPPIPSIEEATSAPVITLNGESEPMSKNFDLQGWQNTYDIKKLCGFIFASGHILEKASESAKEYLKNEYDIDLKDESFKCIDK